jgi:hypothetical protein
MGIIYVANYMYLAKTTGPSTSISNTYILFLTKLQKKGKPSKNDLPKLENDISTILRHQKRAIYCSYR